MQGYTLEQLREKLQATRGETRVKTKEEPVRNQFIQTAVEEVFQEHDWDFNKRVVTDLAADADGVTVPANFSPFNGWYFVSDEGLLQDASTVRMEFSPARGRFRAHGLVGNTFSFTYHIAPPNLLENSTAVVYFPQPMLITDRAYVRLKTAYFPDESSERELVANKRELARLWTRMQRGAKSLTHQSWR